MSTSQHCSGTHHLTAMTCPLSILPNIFPRVFLSFSRSAISRAAPLGYGDSKRVKGRGGVYSSGKVTKDLFEYRNLVEHESLNRKEG